MKKSGLLFFLLLAGLVMHAQSDTIRQLLVKEFMVPMRDGVRLHTVIASPVGATKKYPILILRTPYGAGFPMKPGDSILSVEALPNSMRILLREGYFFVMQDIRGKYKSEGKMQIHQPLIHQQEKNAVDESTDTWDTIDQLIKNLPGNNGKAGILGVSYPGWLALVGSVDPHPALKASSEQACMGDLFLGDDFHHNGAFRLSYGMEYTYEVEWDKTTDSDFPFPQFDLYNWYLNLGSLKNVNEKYFHGKVDTWNNFVKHPDYDAFWQKNSPLNYVEYAQVPMLHVGGYYDQEDLNGPQLMYKHMEEKDKGNQNFLVLGPWFHGQWGRDKADSIGKIAFRQNTAAQFQQLQKKWFDYWLKGVGDGHFDEATCYQTGSNQWKTYSSWPPRNAVYTNLYASAGGTCTFDKLKATTGFVSWISDPAHPVPYRALPIEATYGPGSRWRPWQVEDQRFVTTRPDVVSFVMDPLDENVTVTGKVIAHIAASTSGTDADWIVKLIDVYPDIDSSSLLMSGYQLPVAMEAFRGRYRTSFEHPAPLKPNQPAEFVIDLHDINHKFLKGHRMMIQIQSSWFPVIDRNPQRFVPNIFEAKENDFQKAEHRVWFSAAHPTYISLPVVEE